MPASRAAASLTIRAAEPGDGPALQAIFAACISQADWLPACARLQTDFAAVSQGETIWVAVAADGSICGLVAIQLHDAYLHHLFVAPTAQGQGIGRALLQSLRGWLAPPWQLKCVRANRLAMRFYLANGWQEIGAGESEHGAYALLEWRA
ncbi:N-acetyltransferase family protein [Chitinimonas sp.]|uniref:GNAT family N-acetyltransferase n=1 Tax=Chitinimonas sp. TaxID=1934313 RepID=UPI0035B0154D